MTIRVASLNADQKLEHNGKRRVANAAYYASHATKFRENSRKYRADHLEEVRAKEKRYYTEHPEILLFKCASKRARERGLPCTITAEDIRGCIPRDGLCPITRQPFVRGEGKVGPQSMTLDRIIPELGYVHGNIAVISHLANTIKQSVTDPQVFLRMADYLRRAPLRVVA
jgi:hypothetical protein